MGIRPTPPSSDSDNLTLRDFSRTLRRRRAFLILLTVLGAAVALALALAQPKSYSAQASVAVSDLSQSYAAVGVPIAQAQTPQQLAAGAAQTTTTSPVAARVKRALGSPLGTGRLLSKVSASVDPASNFVVVQASDTTGKGAASLANAFAEQSAAVSNENARAGFAAAANALRTKIRQLGKTQANSPGVIEMQSERARLLSLSQLAQQASVVEHATVPSSPSSPKPVFDAVLGGVIGLIIGIMIAFGRQAFDRRLSDGQEVEALLEFPLLGDLGVDALGRSPISHDDRQLSDLDAESVRIIRRNLDFLVSEDEGRTVAITSPLPQEGKSTLAAALAFAAAGIGKRTLLIEADLRRPVIAERLKIDSTPGLTDYLTGEAKPGDVLQPVNVGPATNGSLVAAAQLVCLVAGTKMSRTDELLGSSRFSDLLKEVSSVYDFVVLDCAPILPVADTLEILPSVDSVVLCVRAGQTTRDQALAARAALMRLPPRPIGVVLTAVRPSDEYGSYAYNYAYTPSGSSS
jgi:succinoglycan biosynthesis transport protein ExoP